MLQMEIPNKPIDLAKFLEISIEALRKQMKRMGLVEGRFNRYAEMDKQTVQLLLEQYGQTDTDNSPAASIETDKNEGAPGNGQVLKNETDKLPKADKVAAPLIRTSGPLEAKADKRTNAPAPATIEKAATQSLPVPEKRTELLKDTLLALIALVSMYVQMNHTAQVVGGAVLQAWAYALSIQFTGLAMTLYKGNLWYLRVFALAEFAINLLYYRPWTDGGVEEWTRSILLSALIAFTIYSYVEIFAARRNTQTDKI